MSRCDKLENKARRNPNGLKFNELLYLAECNGFVFRRQKGTSHRIYTHPFFARPLPFQTGKKGEAKPYQVRQLLDAMDQLRSRES